METKKNLEVVEEMPFAEEPDQQSEYVGKFLDANKPKLYYYAIEVRAKMKDFVKGIDDQFGITLKSHEKDFVSAY